MAERRDTHEARLSPGRAAVLAAFTTASLDCSNTHEARLSPGQQIQAAFEAILDE